MPQDSFTEAVHEIVKLVPQGRVTTYGAIARCLGSSQSARMVGWALHHAVHKPGVPAHRVVNRNGYLTGKHHFVGTNMEALLAAEGVTVVHDQVQHFGQIFWDPAHMI